MEAQPEMTGERSVHGKMEIPVSPPLYLYLRIDMYSSPGLRKPLSECTSTVKVAAKYKGQFLSWQVELLLTIAFH